MWTTRCCGMLPRKLAAQRRKGLRESAGLCSWKLVEALEAGYELFRQGLSAFGP